MTDFYDLHCQMSTKWDECEDIVHAVRIFSQTQRKYPFLRNAYQVDDVKGQRIGEDLVFTAIGIPE